MSNEIKIGTLGVIALLILIFGYKFLSGKNVFSNVTTVKVEYDNVDMLSNSTPVIKNGFQVGVVSDIYIKPDNPGKVMVEYEINGNIKFPKDARMVITPNGLMGDKYVELLYDKPCTDNCAEDGAILSGTNVGMLSSMIGEPSDVEAYVDVLKSGVKSTAQDLNKVLDDPDTDNKLAQTVQELQKTIENLNALTGNLNRLVSSSSSSIAASMSNFQSISGNLESNNDNINKLIANMTTITDNVKNAPLDSTIRSANAVMASSEETVKALQTTLDSTQMSISTMNSILSKINRGEGNLGKLANDDQVYDNIERSTKNLELLLQDLRLNPKRYINVSVFGKKQKEYTNPSDDPAFETEK